mgnify:FL=1
MNLRMNLGTRDRIMRLIGGLTFAIVDYFSDAQWEIVFLLFGIWAVMTSAFGYCPFSAAMGINTCSYRIEELPEIKEELPEIRE